MGLSISTHFLAQMKKYDEEGEHWFEKTLQGTYAALRAQGLPVWEEPTDFPPRGAGPRRHVGSFPYSFLHYLRRAYAWSMRRPDQPLPPAPAPLSSADMDLIEDEASMLSSHLLCHSDSSGLYVPVDFAEPIFDFDSGRIPGGMLGSSHALLRELRQVAPLIGVTLGKRGALGRAELERLAVVRDDDPFEREKVTFLALWENARVSVARGTALVFH